MITDIGLLAFTPYFLTPPIVFVTYIAGAGGGLDPSTVFTSLALINLLMGPLSALFQWMPYIIGVFGYLTRIEDFLREETRHDSRTVSTASTSESFQPSDGVIKVNGQSGGMNGRTDASLVDSNRGSVEAVVVRAGSFGWSKDHEILHDIDLTIKRSQLTMVIGPVASGKSTLCAALLGETPISQGTVQVGISSPEIAFCDQTPFLQNATIKQNIIGTSDFEATWYEKVIDAVALHEDLTALPKGDQSVIGSDGISLSGGQKQRVAIARAVYARKETAIFDDVLSGLDTRTQQDVFNKIFGPHGLLKLNSTAVVLATHATKFLSSADHIVALGREGKIIEQGTFEHLKAAQGYLHSLDVEHYKEDHSAANGYDRDDLPQKPNDKATATQIPPTRSGDKGIYRYYLSSTGVLNCLLALSLALSQIFFGAAPILVLKRWTDPDISHTSANNRFYLGVYFLLRLGGLVSICSLAALVFIAMINRSGLRLHNVVLKTTMSAPMTFFSETDKGVTTNRFSQDMQMVDGELPNSYVNMALCIFQGAGQIILIVVASPFLLLTLPFVAVIFLIVQKVYLKTTRQLRLLDLESKSPL